MSESSKISVFSFPNIYRELAFFGNCCCMQALSKPVQERTLLVTLEVILHAFDYQPVVPEVFGHLCKEWLNVAGWYFLESTTEQQTGREVGLMWLVLSFRHLHCTFHHHISLLYLPCLCCYLSLDLSVFI